MEKEKCETEQKEITVYDLLSKHMQFLAIKAQTSDGATQKAYIEAMEDIQILMNRLHTKEPPDAMLSNLFENRIFLRLSYDSKVLILNHTIQMTDLKIEIGRFMDFLENTPKMQKKLCRSVGWRLFKLFCHLPWGRS